MHSSHGLNVMSSSSRYSLKENNSYEGGIALCVCVCVWVCALKKNLVLSDNTLLAVWSRNTSHVIAVDSEKIYLSTP